MHSIMMHRDNLGYRHYVIDYKQYIPDNMIVSYRTLSDYNQ